jgi:hypothetical protein
MNECGLSHTWSNAKQAMKDFLSTQQQLLGGLPKETLSKRELINFLP